MLYYFQSANATQELRNSTAKFYPALNVTLHQADFLRADQGESLLEDGLKTLGVIDIFISIRKQQGNIVYGVFRPSSYDCRYVIWEEFDYTLNVNL